MLHRQMQANKKAIKTIENKNSPREGAIFVTNRIESAISAGHRLDYYSSLSKRKVKNYLMIF
jgi:hypothetical protein